MNWGYKILTVIILFVVAMISMVFIAMKQSNDLIEENYYEKELAYQSQIEAGRRLDKLQTGMLLQNTAGNIILNLPAGSYEQGVTGSIEFLRKDDATKDVHLKLQPDTGGQQLIEKKLFDTGSYQVRIKWQHNATDYYQQEDLMIQ